MLRGWSTDGENYLSVAHPLKSAHPRFLHINAWVSRADANADVTAMSSAVYRYV